MTVREAIEARRSIRKYLPEPVAEEDLQQILDAGRLAPSGCNAQPWRFVVVRDAAIKEQLAAEAMTLQINASICRAAPVMIACLAVVDAHCEIPQRLAELSEAVPDFANAAPTSDGKSVLTSRFEAMPREARSAYMSLNVAIALTQMVLQATELGYGTCWLGAFDRALAQQILEIPDGLEVVAMTPLGRPAEDPPSRPRLELEALVFGDRYGRPL